MEKKIEEKFEVRDLRAKDRFQVDDEFLNGYAKIIGPVGISVYVALCRYSNKEQKCWPSQKTIAHEIGVSEPTVIEYLKVLEFLNIIRIKRVGKTCTNRYWLLDKKQWMKKEVILSSLSSPDIKQFKFSTKAVLVHYLSSFSSNKGINSKELKSKVDSKESANTQNSKTPSSDTEFITVRNKVADYFVSEVKKIENIEPEINYSQLTIQLKKFLQKYTKKQLKSLIDFYLNSDRFKEHGPNLGVVFSAYTINLWLHQEEAIS